MVSEPSVLTLSEAEAEAIQSLAVRLARTSPLAPMQYVERARDLGSADPALDRLRSALHAEPHALRVRGLRAAAGPSTSTPTARASASDVLPIPAATLALVAGVVGLHRGFEREFEGQLLHSIAPIATNSDLQINSSSAVELELHTEMAYAEHAPDYVLLLCVRKGIGSAATLLVSLADVVERLPDAVVDALCEPRFMTSVDVVERGRPEPLAGPMPVLSRRADNLTARCDFAEIQATDDASLAALAAMHRTARLVARPVTLDEGDLLVADNRRALHGRVPFEARHDGSDRWLLRAYVWADGGGVPQIVGSPVVPGNTFASPVRPRPAG
ncbi:MAG TPA: TauD/TfdA family dioxygenase [Allosphingosinicella sp.]|nr:TauD/TfdA family dioxygenase [Allosphingosinicella sp.]